ncbi:hypothetical protein BKA65DRAFT_545897 [Rhexocercosporidium sp. MPI-PUGE-AT-0058]|nr:hypothetical protein BKA65DRAFT_545897 [Rhexocercosporidium sp. MPI-PUGE-AT-0058]
MPLRRSQTRATKEREERKKRQEKFRKRTRSLFNKTRLLAKDTDAWVALIVRDRAGRVQSIRSSGSRYWPPSIQDLMKAYPSGTHEFLEKEDISGCWKEVTGDANDAVLDHSEADSSDEDVEETIMISEKDPEPDTTMPIEQHDTDKTTESGKSPRQEKPNEPVAEHSRINPLHKSDKTQLSQVKELSRPSVDGGQVQDTAATHTRECGISRVDSTEKDTVLDAGMPDDTMFEFEKLEDTMIDATEGSNDTTSNMVVEEPAVPGEAIAIDKPSTAADLLTAGYDMMMDLDIPGAERRAHKDVSEGEGSSALSTMSQHPNSPSSGSSASWQVVNRPKMDPRDLLQRWDWVFGTRDRPYGL